MVLSKFLSACTSRLASKPSLCIGMSDAMRLPPGLLLLERTGGWPFSPALSIAWILGIVCPELAAGAEAVVAGGAAEETA